jgi:hypothetical protein
MSTDLFNTVKVLIEKGDKAKAKSEQFYIAAGQHLKTLKTEHTGNTAEWEALLKEKCGIGKSRAYELMKIADGRATVEEVRAEKAESVRKVRGRIREEADSVAAAIPLRSGKSQVAEPEEDMPDYGAPGQSGDIAARKRGILNRASEAVRLAEFDSLTDLEIDAETEAAIRAAAAAWLGLIPGMSCGAPRSTTAERIVEMIKPAIVERALPAIQQALTPIAGDPGEIPGFLRRVQ